MTAYKKCRNVTSGKHSSGQKRKLTDRDKRVLTRIVARKCKQLSQITSEVNSHLRTLFQQEPSSCFKLVGRVGKTIGNSTSTATPVVIFIWSYKSTSLFQTTVYV
ncbi:hypothetical protein TNCV_3245781 [Trichonephila clavipes]|nr:hypothetical protein TNCV_3245781 [Trichonephila clavipes]